MGSQVGRNAEAYIDDIVIKTKEPGSLIEDLEETFKNLKAWQWKLNPTKCVFGVPSGQLVRFLVSNRGIEASTKQVKAIMDMKPPKKVKDIEAYRMHGSTKQIHLPTRRKRATFLQIIEKGRNFEWTEEAEKAFQKLKEYLASSPVMTPPKDRGHDAIHYSNQERCHHNNCG